MRSAVQGTSLDDASAHISALWAPVRWDRRAVIRSAALDAGAGPRHSRTQSGTGAFIEPSAAAGRIRRVGRDCHAVGQH
jgi:hypothetical protein